MGRQRSHFHHIHNALKSQRLSRTRLFPSHIPYQTNEKSDGYEGSVRDNVHQESSETPPTAVSPAIIAGGIAGVAAVATIAFIATKGWKARSLAKDVEFEEFADEEQQ